MTYAERKIAVNDFFKLSEDEVKHQVQNIALSWEELKQQYSEPIANIVAYTVNHLSLAHLTYEEASTEIIESKRELEYILLQNIYRFAYPYGGLDDAADREWKIAEQFQFKTVVMNHPGNLFKTNNCTMMHLPRYPM